MDSPEHEKKSDVRRPMNAFLIFCKRHRSMVREKNPDLDNRSVTRILGDLWANLGEREKSVYTSLAKQYKDAFMKANPDYKWHNPDKLHQTPTKMTTRPTNARALKHSGDIQMDGGIIPGKLADPSKMGGLSLLLMAGQQSLAPRHHASHADRRVTSPDPKCSSSKSALLELAEMCANELHQNGAAPPMKKSCTKPDPEKKGRVPQQKKRGETGKSRSKSESDSLSELSWQLKLGHSAGEQENKSVAMGTSLSQSRLPPGASLPRQSEKVGSRKRSWSESAMDEDENRDNTGADASCRSSETLAGCLLERTESAVSPRGKMDVDNIETQPTDIAQAAVTIKREDSIKDLEKSFTTGQRKDVKTEDSPKDEKTSHSRIEHLVADAYANEKAITHEKEYKPIIRVPDFKSFKMASDMTTKRVASEAFGSEVGSSEIQIKKKTMSLALQEVKAEPTECGTAVTPEGRTERSDQECCGSNGEDERDREDGSCYQPVRKSRRRNKGQRYLELINEGIIQPSKERLAARRAEQTSTDDESLWCYEDMVIDEEVQEVRKQSHRKHASDSENPTDDRKYKTGDFDLEAQIATLPACSLDPVTRGNRQKATPTKVRHHSEGSGKKCSAGVTSPTSVGVDQKTLALPPHLKLQKDPVKSSQPVSGSRKRKARKYSINHLLSPNGEPPVKGENESIDVKQENDVNSNQSDESNAKSVGNKDVLSKSETGRSAAVAKKEKSEKSGDKADQSEPTSKSRAEKCSPKKPQSTVDEIVKKETDVKSIKTEIDRSSHDRSVAFRPAQSQVKLERTDRGYDQNANMTESRVLDFRTPKCSAPEEISHNPPFSSSSVSESSVQSNNNAKTMQLKVVDELSGKSNIDETKVQTEPRQMPSAVSSKVAGSDEPSVVMCKNVSRDKQQVDSGLSNASPQQGNTPPTSASSPVLRLPGDDKSLPDLDRESSKLFPTSTSAVKIVTFSSAPSTVSLATLTTTAVAQAVSLEVLAENADDGPATSMAQSALATGSPSVAVVHS